MTYEISNEVRTIAKELEKRRKEMLEVVMNELRSGCTVAQTSFPWLVGTEYREEPIYREGFKKNCG